MAAFCISLGLKIGNCKKSLSSRKILQKILVKMVQLKNAGNRCGRSGGGTMPVVYIDVLFLVNMMIDGMLLWCSTKIAGVRTRWWRIFIAAVIGGVYAVCVFFPKLSALYLLAAKVAVSVIMVCIVFWVKTWRELLRAITIFYLTSFIFGGGITGLIYFTGIGSRLGAIVSGGAFI